MNRWNTKVIWGFGLILFGLALTARELGLITFSIFFPGWWTFFIIIPCAKSIVERKNGIITNIGFGVGLLLFLNAQDIVSWDILGTLFVAILFLIVGISLIFKKPNNNHDRIEYSKSVNSDTAYDDVHVKRDEYDKENTKNYDTEYKKEDTMNYSAEYQKEDTIDYDTEYKKEDTMNYSAEYQKEDTIDYNTEYKKEDTINYNNEYNKDNTTGYNHDYIREDRENQYKNKEQSRTNSSYHGGSNYTAFFSANNHQYVNEEFRGATISSILGNVQLDLRNAIIYEDSVINVTCILGGIDIYVPSNIRIINQCTAILAGVDANVMSPRNMSENSYTIYIKGNCLLGGIEIK